MSRLSKRVKKTQKTAMIQRTALMNSKNAPTVNLRNIQHPRTEYTSHFGACDTSHTRFDCIQFTSRSESPNRVEGRWYGGEGSGGEEFAPQTNQVTALQTSLIHRGILFKLARHVWPTNRSHVARSEPCTAALLRANDPAGFIAASRRYSCRVVGDVARTKSTATGSMAKQQRRVDARNFAQRQ